MRYKLSNRSNRNIVFQHWFTRSLLVLRKACNSPAKGVNITVNVMALNRYNSGTNGPDVAIKPFMRNNLQKITLCGLARIPPSFNTICSHDIGRHIYRNHCCLTLCTGFELVTVLEVYVNLTSRGVLSIGYTVYNIYMYI